MLFSEKLKKKTWRNKSVPHLRRNNKSVDIEHFMMCLWVVYIQQLYSMWFYSANFILGKFNQNIFLEFTYQTTQLQG